MQTFVEQQIRVLRQCLPGGERAGPATVDFTLFLGVNVIASLSGTAVGERRKQCFELREQVSVRAEMRQHATLFGRFFDLALHRLAVVTMKTVTLDYRRGDAFALEYALESKLDARGTGAGRPGDGYDGMACRHMHL